MFGKAIGHIKRRFYNIRTLRESTIQIKITFISLIDINRSNFDVKFFIITLCYIVVKIHRFIRIGVLKIAVEECLKNG